MENVCENVCGLLIEPRYLTNTSYLIENFIKVKNKTGNEKLTKLFFYCGSSKYKFYSNLYKKNSLIEVISLGLDNLLVHQHNDLLKSLKIWEYLKSQGFSHVLTIQTDGCLCEQSEFTINNFLKYDYIGGYTPYKWWWKETKGLHDYNDYQCFNGGFSLRRIDCLINVIKNFGTMASTGYNENLDFRAYGEDLYFVCGMLKLGYNVGKDIYATNFCTHTHWVSKSFCVHKLDNYINNIDDLTKFLEYCPEFVQFIAKYD